MTDSSLELYKVVVDSISQNEAKRLQGNATYLGFLGALFTVTITTGANYVAFASLILVVAILWFFTIRYHRELAKAKFTVLSNIEENFDIKPFAEEWKIYKGNRWPITLTRIEMLVPLLTIALTAGYLIWWGLKYACVI